MTRDVDRLVAQLDRLASVQLQIQQMANSQRDLTDKVNASQQELSSLQSGLAGRVADNEQAVTAIDAYRIQLNNRLAGIERRLDGLSATPGY